MKRITKWGAGLVMAISLMFMADQAGAVELGLYETGVLVPVVTHNGTNVDTVVGLTALQANTVYWTFFDNNSTHVVDGEFDVTRNDLYQFSWKIESGMGLEDLDGYLVFTIADPDDNGMLDPLTANATLGANAFMVDTSTDDAVFIPVVPLNIVDYLVPVGGINLTGMDRDSICQLTHGTREDTTLDVRYWVDPAYGAHTTIVVWTVASVENEGVTVNIYNEDEIRHSLNFLLENQELNVINPADLVGMPSDYLDGFIRWALPPADPVIDANVTSADGMVYTYISSTFFGAQQTLLSMEDWMAFATP